jgi:basic amino acid/polyamine antiporter, APA family
VAGPHVELRRRVSIVSELSARELNADAEPLDETKRAHGLRDIRVSVIGDAGLAKIIDCLLNAVRVRRRFFSLDSIGLRIDHESLELVVGEHECFLINVKVNAIIEPLGKHASYYLTLTAPLSKRPASADNADRPTFTKPAMPHEPSTADRAAPRRQLTLLDSTSIIVGIIIGSGMYKTAPLIAQNVPSGAALLGVWLLGGLFALLGSFCYAELATALPEEGGDYRFLSRAYGRPMGFLFAWCELWMVRPGSIGSLAFVFADYANQVVPLGPNAPLIYAAGAVALLTAVNVLGVVMGKWTQNILTLAKLAGLLAVVVIGFGYSSPVLSAAGESASGGAATADWARAMIFILYAYGGWNDMAYVSAEVRDPNRNIVRALLLGTATVTAIYVLVNAAFLHALGFTGVRQAEAVAADVVRLAAGDWGARAVSVLVAVSALGAINGMIFTGARIYYALGTEHRLFRRLGVWNAGFDSPVASLLAQGAITVALVVAFGWSAGPGRDAFVRMVDFALPAFWFFLLLVGLAVVLLRWREPELARPYRTLGYPLTPVLFCSGTGFMLYSSLSYAYSRASIEMVWALCLVLLGLALSAIPPEASRGKGV